MSQHDPAHFDAELLSFYETTADNVCGVGFGFKTVNGVEQTTPSVIFHVRQKKPKAEIPEHELLPATLVINGQEYQTDVIEVPEDSIRYMGTCYEYFNEADPEIARLQGFPNALLPMRGGQEIVMCPEGSNAYGGISVGTLGFFAIDVTDNKIVGVTNTHVVVHDTVYSGDVTRPPAEELLDIKNIIEPKHWALDGQKYPSCAHIRNDGATFHPAVLHVKRYVPQYSQQQVNANNTLSNNVDAALLIMNDGKFGNTDTYFVDETSFTVRRPSDMEALENNNPPLLPPYLPFASRAEMDDMFSQILNNGATVYVRSTGRTTGPKGYCEARKIRITQRIVSQSGTSNFPPYKDIFEIKPATDALPGTIAGNSGDSGSAIIADFTTEEAPNDVAELSRVGTLVTATVTNHGYTTNDSIKIIGASPTNFNGTYLITVVDTDTFTYNTVTNGTVTATGTITARRVQITPKIIGLLFAGTFNGSGVPIASLCCRIDNVADALGIRAWLPEDDFDRVNRLKVPAPKIVTRARAENGLDLAITVNEIFEGGTELPMTYWHAGCTIQGYPPLVEPGSTVIGLSNNSLYENNTIGQTIGQFLVVNSVSDFVVLDAYMFELVDGIGDTDNASFTILNDQLRAAVVFDAEVKTTYSIRVRATNSSGVSVDQVLTIKVRNLEDLQPTNLLLAPDTIARGAAGRYVGAFSAISPSATDVFSYFLVPGNGAINNNQFAISGNSLFIAVATKTAETKSIRVRAQNNYNLLYEKTFQINIT
ncbi:MAG: hypothetical protein EBZ69_00750 [Alphaproteobacteria bacterium]|nr:hypothetical protein [Alphaproteobacteria bacterium]